MRLFRIRISHGAFDVGDRIRGFRQEILMKEWAFLRKLPTPSDVIKPLEALVFWFAYRIDDQCPACQWSPNCSPGCPKPRPEVRP